MASARVLMLGDVVGESGIRAIDAGLADLVRSHRADFVIVNAENAADGFGITPSIAEHLWDIGISVITTGNHIWQRSEIRDYLPSHPTLLRPANYPDGAPGTGSCVARSGDLAVAVINLQGRVRLPNIDCPFRKAERLVKEAGEKTKSIIIDFHADDTEEKEALAAFLDGTVSAVAGTHTHVQTADARISENGTAFITDIGMTGPVSSVIGFDPAIARERMVTQMPLKMEVSGEKAAIRAVAFEIDSNGGRCTSIDTIEFVPKL